MNITLVMGFLTFLVGLTMELLNLMAILDIAPLDKIELGERLVLFFGGVILMVLGYVMARNLPQPSVTVEEIPPVSTTASEELPPP